MVMSVLDGSPNRVKLTPERTHDTSPWRRVESWVKGRLLLFDLGYFAYHLFDRIDAHGGFFLTRMKSHANPRIVAVHRRWRGQSVPVVGEKLQDVLGRLQREILDVQVEVSFDKRAYRGKHAKAQRTFRLIAVRDAQDHSYHVYLTNVPPDALAAEDVTQIYALRWQVELLFKAMKHHGHLDQLPSRKQAVVECLIWASVLAAVTSQTLYRLVRQAVAPSRFLPLLRWASRFGREAVSLLTLVVGQRDQPAARELWASLCREAPDPNRNRPDRAVHHALCASQP
jgi:IS4 transposase